MDIKRIESSWTKATSWVDSAIDRPSSSVSPNSVLKDIVESKLGDLLVEWTFGVIKTKILTSAAEDFKTKLQCGNWKQLSTYLELAHSCFGPVHRLCSILDENVKDGKGECCSRLRSTFDDMFLLGDPACLKLFRSFVLEYLGRQFRSHHQQHHEEEEDSEEDEMEIGDETYPLGEFANHISGLRWFLLVEEPLSQILCHQTERYIVKVCQGNYECHLLGKVCSWLESVLLNWLQTILRACSREDTFAQWKARLEFHVFETLCELRMTELFDVIAEFPESSPSLGDLKDCLARTHEYRELVLSLRHAFATRLLHPGANTSQILDVYISTIKALRLLDPSGVLLESISEPIKSYLRKREDTVRCIVTSLTDDSNSELFEELGRGDGDIKPIAQSYNESDDEDDDEDESDIKKHEEWTPDPIEADPYKTRSSRKSNDILSMLVHIYGSKELFVNEYRLMLADKLLSSLEFDAEREVRNLELLKLRFGEGSMLNCEIMIKDIEDSKRINTNIKNTLQNKTDLTTSADTPSSKVENLEVTIVSKQFWPTLHGDEITPHPAIKQRMSAISHEYSVLKNPRQLVWKTNLGLVNLELEFDQGQQTKSFTVTPLLATLVMHIAERDVWVMNDLASVCGLDNSLLRKKMVYWVNQGVVRQGKDSHGNILYSAVDKLSEDHHHQSSGVQDDVATEQAVSADAQLAEEMKIYESFVRGMLNNYESLPLDRIHNMLKMFVSTGEHKYDKNVSQLGQFLDKLVRDDVLEYENGAYFLKKSTK